MTNDSYKTPFERILEFGFHAYNISLTSPNSESSRAILIDEGIPFLVSHTDKTKGQFYVVRERKIKKRDDFYITYLLAVQGSVSNTIKLEKMHARGELYEILSVWETPYRLTLPDFELSACVDNWYIDNLEPEKGKQEYNPRKMTSRTLEVINKKIELPPPKHIPIIEID